MCSRYRLLANFFLISGYLNAEVEKIKKRALTISCSGVAYNDALELAAILTITAYNDAICNKLFDNINKDQNNLRHKLLPPSNNLAYSPKTNCNIQMEN